MSINQYREWEIGFNEPGIVRRLPSRELWFVVRHIEKLRFSRCIVESCCIFSLDFEGESSGFKKPTLVGWSTSQKSHLIITPITQSIANP
jgi:hypothetical protein